MLYLYSGEELFLTSIIFWDDLPIEKDVGGSIKDEFCYIEKSLLGWHYSQEHDYHAFLYVEIMWRESSRRERVQEFRGEILWNLYDHLYCHHLIECRFSMQ